MDFDKLRKANHDRSMEWMGKLPDEADVEFCAIELGGEVGELLNVIKKWMRCRLSVTGGISDVEFAALAADELGDIIICCDRIAAAIGIDLKEATRQKFNKTSAKHGFSTRIERCNAEHRPIIYTNRRGG